MSKTFKITKRLTNVDTKDLALYLREISQINIDENELYSKVMDGDEDAKDKLVLANLRFVVSVAKNYENMGVPLVDLINEGNYGLILASKLFNPTVGVKFFSFGVHYIRKHIREAINNQGYAFRIPATTASNLSTLNNRVKELEQDLGYEPSESELYYHLGEDFNDSTIKTYISTFNKKVKYTSESVSSDNETTIGDLIIGNSDFNIEDYCDYNSKIDILENSIDTLSNEEKYILNSKFGLNGFLVKDEATIAKDIKTTPRLVKKKIESILKQLKNEVYGL